MLDIKSRSNNPTKDAVEKEDYAIIKETEKIRKPKNGMVVYFIMLMLLSATIGAVVSVMNYDRTAISFNSEEDMVAHYSRYFLGDYEINRYAKNINRFFIDFDGYNFNEDEFREGYGEALEKQQSEAVLAYKTDPEYLAERQEIENFYNGILIDYYTSADESEPELSGNHRQLIFDDRITGNQSVYDNVENFLAKRDGELGILDKTYESIYKRKAEDSGVNEFMEEEISYYYQIKEYLESNYNLEYLIKDKMDRKYLFADGEIVQLSDEEYREHELKIKEMYGSLVFPLRSENLSEIFNGEPLNKSFIKNGVDGYFYASQSLIDQIMNYSHEVSNVNHGFEDRLIACAISAGICILILLIRCRHDLGAFKRGSAVYYGIYAKFPFLIKLALFGIAPILFIFMTYDPVFALYFIFIFIGPFIYMSIIYFLKHVFKNFRNLKNEPEIRLIKKYTKDFYYVNKSKKIFTIILFYTMLLGFVVIGTPSFLLSVLFLLSQGYLGELILATVVYVLGMAFYKYYVDFTVGYCKLCYYIKQIYEGADIMIEEREPAKMEIHYLNNLRRGFVESVNKMIKSERMKTQLITNVSHDLKTPLTSIINYLELIKKDPQGAHTREYLEILEAKSQRLKFLIEDLFEASKLSAGEVELNLEKVNVCDLIKQTVGELSGKIEETNLDLRMNFDSENIYLKLDGKKMWRVFENLLNNIIKYSIHGTRAYITVEEEPNEVIITFKNISNHEINFDKMELFERFKRGDDSRSTEGNGLGLSIAQSIINLHGGFVDIVVDGDLFKVIIIFRK